jgi:hypothetical protein
MMVYAMWGEVPHSASWLHLPLHQTSDFTKGFANDCGALLQELTQAMDDTLTVSAYIRADDDNNEAQKQSIVSGVSAGKSS